MPIRRKGLIGGKEKKKLFRRNRKPDPKKGTRVKPIHETERVERKEKSVSATTGVTFRKIHMKPIFLLQNFPWKCKRHKLTDFTNNKDLGKPPKTLERFL